MLVVTAMLNLTVQNFGRPATLIVTKNETVLLHAEVFGRVEDFCVNVSCIACNVSKLQGDECGRLLNVYYDVSGEGLLNASLYDSGHSFKIYIIVGCVTVLVASVVLLVLKFFFNYKMHRAVHNNTQQLSECSTSSTMQPSINL